MHNLLIYRGKLIRNKELRAFKARESTYKQTNEPFFQFQTPWFGWFGVKYYWGKNNPLVASPHTSPMSYDRTKFGNDPSTLAEEDG